jgi:Mg2+ and Co2+ transporter CorA
VNRMGKSPFSWLDRQNASAAQIEAEIASFESRNEIRLHWIAKHHLTDGSGIANDPFPRIEEHDGYLFGILYVPSNTTDTFAQFDELVFVATHDEIFGAYTRTDTSTADWPALFESSSSARVFDQSGDEGGRSIVRTLKTVVKQLLRDVENFADVVLGISATIGQYGNADGDVLADTHALSHRQRRKLNRAAQEQREPVSRLRREVPLMRRVIVETETVLNQLATDVIDLNTDASGSQRQLFARDLEIFISDLYVDARHATSVVNDIEDRLEHLIDYLKQLRAEETVAASRFTGAIASIMLVPTFIVGLYGQNFDQMPERSWDHGYLFSWGLILVVTIGQVWFFRKRRWI